MDISSNIINLVLANLLGVVLGATLVVIFLKKPEKQYVLSSTDAHNTEWNDLLRALVHFPLKGVRERFPEHDHNFRVLWHQLDKVKHLPIDDGGYSDGLHDIINDIATDLTESLSIYTGWWATNELRHQMILAILAGAIAEYRHPGTSPDEMELRTYVVQDVVFEYNRRRNGIIKASSPDSV